MLIYEICTNFIPFSRSSVHLSISSSYSILFFFWALAIKRMPAIRQESTPYLLLGYFCNPFYRMPVVLPVRSATTQGSIYGILILPIGWIIVSSVFLYKLTVKTGHLILFETLLFPLLRIVVCKQLLVAFSFGAFL